MGCGAEALLREPSVPARTSLRSLLYTLQHTKQDRPNVGFAGLNKHILGKGIFDSRAKLSPLLCCQTIDFARRQEPAISGNVNPGQEKVGQSRKRADEVDIARSRKRMAKALFAAQLNLGQADVATQHQCIDMLEGAFADWKQCHAAEPITSA